MRKYHKIAMWVGLLLCCGEVRAQTTTYTGTIKDLTLNLVTSGQIAFTLAPPTDSTVPGTGRFVPTTTYCSINSDGSLSGYVGGVVSGACIVVSNTALSPTGTSYRTCVQPYFATPGSCFYLYATGGTIDISTVAPTLSTGPISYVSTTTYFPGSPTVTVSGAPTAGQALIASGPSAAIWQKLAPANLAAESANTILGNATAGSASPTALAMPSCSGAAQALSWTTSSGFGCNTIAQSFATLTGGTNSAALLVAGSLGTSGAGTIAATSIGGVVVTGTPAAGQAIVATTSTTADWQTIEGGGGGASNINVTQSGNLVGSRFFNTTYQNTGGTALFVTGWGITAGSQVGNIACFDGPTSATLEVYSNEATATVNAGAAGFVCMVPNGFYYNVMSRDAVGPVGGWYEDQFTGSASGGVTSLNVPAGTPLTGPLTIACGTGLSCTQSGSTITIAIATAFTINSFTGCGGALELGASVTNPVCAATYSATPTSASISNTDSVDSPLTLTTPFTSGTIAGTLTHAAVASTTVTLTAIGSSTQTATQQYTWNPRIFGGVGATGATSTVTASGTTAVLSTSDVLASVQLGAESVGEVFGPYVTSGSNVYLLLTGNAHAFVDTSTGFPFSFLTPVAVSFVNVHGVTVTMYLYQSTNPLYGTFNLRMTS